MDSRSPNERAGGLKLILACSGAALPAESVKLKKVGKYKPFERQVSFL